MIYGELGATQLYNDIQTRVISFWCNLIQNSVVYKTVSELQEQKEIKSQWIENVKCSNGFSGVWYSQSFINATWLQKALKQKLNDIFIQNWNWQVKSTSDK